MYRKVAGLSQLEPGYKKFQVKPMFVKGIEECGTEFESVYGKIVANTSCKNGKIHVHVEVPANTTAVIVLPEKEEVHEVGSGVYNYEYDTETSLAVERFSMDSTLGEIVAEPLAVEMFNQMAPGNAGRSNDPVRLWNDTRRTAGSCATGQNRCMRQ